MGVYYPPTWSSTDCFRSEPAYTASLVLHTLWGGLGATGRRGGSGVSAAGSALAGFAWAASGFFVIHLPHQWGYTTGELDALGVGTGLVELSSPRGDPVRTPVPAAEPWC